MGGAGDRRRVGCDRTPESGFSSRWSSASWRPRARPPRPSCPVRRDRRCPSDRRRARSSPATSSPAPSAVATASAQDTAAAAAIDGLIVFSRHDPATDDTFCFTIDPSGANEAQGHAGDCGPPSPDGSKILTTVYQPNGFGPLLGGRPATTNPDGSGFKELDSYPDDTFNVTCVYWSPDGLRFLCESGGDGNPADDGIYTMRSSDGGDRVRITRAPAGHEDQPQGYSPDGSRILFERLSDSEPSAEYVVKTDGTGLVRLSPASLWTIDFAWTADWSPDGKQVVFASAVEAEGHPGLYVVNADGTGLHQIVSPDVGGPNGPVVTGRPMDRIQHVLSMPAPTLRHPSRWDRKGRTDGRCRRLNVAGADLVAGWLEAPLPDAGVGRARVHLDDEA